MEHDLSFQERIISTVTLAFQCGNESTQDSRETADRAALADDESHFSGISWTAAIPAITGYPAVERHEDFYKMEEL